MAKSAKIKFISPIGTANYPHLSSPDLTGKYADGKFKTKLSMSGEVAAPFIQFLRDAAKTMVPDVKVPKLGFKIEEDGSVTFSFKSKFAPAVIDPGNAAVNLKKLGDDFRIGGGSKVRIAGELFAYDEGISLQMKQVQVLSIVTGRQSMFDEAEGDFDASEYVDEPTEAQIEAAENALGI